MNDTSVSTDVLAALDFDASCQLTYRRTAFGKLVGKGQPCEKSAAWSAATPCCGIVVLICDEHFHTRDAITFHCRHCSRNLDGLLDWRRL